MQPGRDRAHGQDRLRGRDRRPQARRRDRRTGSRPPTTSARSRSAAPSRGSATCASEHERITFTADDAAVAELSQALVEAGALIKALAPQTVTLEDLFFSLTEGKERRARRRRSMPTRRGGDGMNSPGVATVYRWELTKLRYQKRTYLGLGAADARADPVRARHPLPPRRRRSDFPFAPTSTAAAWRCRS